jgi:large subunit ribosomal protein L46
MNTFFVGNHPVGHYIQSFSSPQPSQTSPSPSPSPKATTTDTSKSNPSTPLKQDLAAQENSPVVDGAKTFFMKARILAGQVDLGITENNDVADFKWVSKDEIEKLVGEEYWVRVRNMLVAQ